MFDISSLQYNSEHPTLIAVGFTVVCALLLGVLIAFTYDKTSKYVNRPDHFIQALILVTIVSATIIQGIGDSVARGLGMLGALSIIRFRTTVRDPRNIIFMFSAIAAGIACGVLGFVIAICGTVAFCITAFLLWISPFNRKDALVASLKIRIPKVFDDIKRLEAVIDRYSNRSMLKTINFQSSPERIDIIQRIYSIKFYSVESCQDLIRELQNINGVQVHTLEIKESSFDNI